MGFFYFDESIHDRAGFILGAYVYTEKDIAPLINRCLLSVDLRPGHDEFKSSSLMVKESKQRELREKLRNLFSNVKLGLVVVPSSERQSLGVEALKGLKKICRANQLTNQHHDVYFDEGIAFQGGNRVAGQLKLDSFCTLLLDQDSRKVAGLQLADLAAHTMSVMLLETLGVISKTVKAGANSGYDPDLDIDLGFELWASIRYHLFTQDEVDIEADPIEGFTLDTGSYAVHIAESCSPVLSNAVEQQFGICYVGCIH